MHVIKEVLSAFDVLYKRKLGARYPFNGGKDSKTVKDLLAIYSRVELEAYMAAFFTMDDPFFHEAGYSLGCFRACLPKVIRHCNLTLKGAGAASVKTVLRAVDRYIPDPTWEPLTECPHERKCFTRGTCQMKISAERREEQAS